MAALRSWCRGVLFLSTWAAEARALPPAASLPLDGPQAGDLDVSVGVRSESGTALRGLAGFLALNVPLDRFAAPRAVASSADETPTAPPAGAPQSLERPESDLTIAPVLSTPELARLTRDTVVAALRREKLPEQARELDSLAARARSSATLPELRLRATRSHDEALRLAPTTDDPYRFSLAGGNALVLEASASWRLNRLVFADEELPVERMRLEQERVRERLVARIVEKVLAWHRALSYARAPDERLRVRAELERLEAEVELDVTTGGWFADRARKLLERASTPPRAPARERALPSTTPHSREGTPPPAPVPHFPEAERSARSEPPCLPMRETESRTFCGVSMR